MIITGTGFTNGAQVIFDGNKAAAAAVNVTSPTTIAAVTPSHAAGDAAIEVALPDGSKATAPASVRLKYQ